MMRRACKPVTMIAVLAVSMMVCGGLYAADRQSVGQDVTIAKDEVQRGDVLVANASVKVLGQVKGSVAVLHGNVEVAPGAQVRGDVVVLGGELKSEGEIAGDRVAVRSLDLGALVGAAMGKQGDLETKVRQLVHQGDGSRVSVGQPLHIAENERVDGDVVVIGADADVAGKVRGAVVVVGGALRVAESADVADDAIAIGGRIEVPRKDCVRGKAVAIESDWIVGELKGLGASGAAGGEKAEAPGEGEPSTEPAPAPSTGERTVQGPVTHLSGDYTVHADEHVQGEITILNGDLRIEGPVDGAVTVLRGDVELSGDGKIGGALTALLGDVALSDRAVIDGPVTAKGDVLVKDNARIGGPVTSLSGEIRTEGAGRIDGPRTPAGLWGPPGPPSPNYARHFDHPVAQWFGMTILGGGALLLCLAFFGERVRRVERMIRERAGPSFGWGSLVALLAIPVSIVLCVLIITIPVAMVGWAWLAALMVLGGAGLSLFVGNWCMARLGRSDGSLLIRSCLGFGVLSFLQLVALSSRPGSLGRLIEIGLLAAGLLALGAATISDFGGRTEPARPWPFRRRRANGNGGDYVPTVAPPPPPPPPPPPWPAPGDPFDATPRQAAPTEDATSADVRDADAPLPILGDEKPEPDEPETASPATGPNPPPPPQ